MTNSFRIEASEMQAWHESLAGRLEVRGVPAIAKELEAHLAKKGADGTVIVSRHQLFTWAEALQGAASRDTRGPSAGAPVSLAQIVADMRSILSGKPQTPAAAPPRAPAYAPPAYAPPAYPPPAYAPAAPASSAPVAYTRPPAVVYGAPSGPTAPAGGGALVTGPALAGATRDIIRTARSDLFISSPWETGIETLIADIVALPPDVRVHILSRRPAQETPAYHQAMDQLGRRRAVTAFSPHIQTRMIVQDDTRALVGAASIPGAASREAAILLHDRASVAAARAHIERAHKEASGAQR